MGASACFCCFANQQPKCLSITGIITSILSFGILIWGIADLEFKRKGVQTIYTMSFTFTIFIIFAFIILSLLSNLQKSSRVVP